MSENKAAGSAPEDLSNEEVAAVPVVVVGKGGERLEQQQWVVRERPVTLYLNGREIVTLLCAGRHLEELAAGFFYGEGFISSPQDIERLEVDPDAGTVEVTASGDTELVENLWMKRTVTSGCGKGSLFHYSLDALLAKKIEGDLRVSARQIVERIEDLNRLSDTYRRTHGVHNTALASTREILLFRNDIGRHNAVDMIVGHVFLKGMTLSDKLLITTGRLTSEILIKIARVGIPVLVSRNAATSLAVELAGSLGITLIGYARAGKFTVYAGGQRVRD